MLIIPTLLIVSAIVFLLCRFIPGNVVDIIEANVQSSSGSVIDRAAVEHMLGLDVPIYQQYIRWIGGILHGDLGVSLLTHNPVTDEILSRMPVTFELGLLAILIGAIVAIPIGIVSAIRQDSTADYAGRTFAILMISVPGFWIATCIMIYPSIWWGWSPPMELVRFTDDPMGNLAMFLLPSAIMGLASTGGTMRMTRTMMLEVLRQDYVRTAWSKGLSERLVVLRHAFKNAMIPVVTIMGYQLPVLIGGSVIIEQIFVLPGMGRLMLDSLNQRDYPVISAINLVISAFVCIVNVGVDMTYGLLDPRIRYS